MTIKGLLQGSHLEECMRIHRRQGLEAAKAYAQQHREELQAEFDEVFNELAESIAYAANQIRTGWIELGIGFDDQRTMTTGWYREVEDE